MKTWNREVAFATVAFACAVAVGCAAPMGGGDGDEVTAEDEIRSGEALGFSGTVTREAITTTANGDRTFGPSAPVGAGTVSIRFQRTERSCGDGVIPATVRAKVPALDGSGSTRKTLSMILSNEAVTFNTNEWVGTAKDGDTTYEIRFQNTLSEICQSHAGKKDALTAASFGMWNDVATQNLTMK